MSEDGKQFGMLINDLLVGDLMREGEKVARDRKERERRRDEHIALTGIKTFSGSQLVNAIVTEAEKEADGFRVLPKESTSEPTQPRTPSKIPPPPTSRR